MKLNLLLITVNALDFYDLFLAFTKVNKQQLIQIIVLTLEEKRSKF